MNSLKKDQYPGRVGGGGLFLVLVIGKWGCTAGWGRVFYCLIDYYGVAVSIELLEWDRTFSGFGGSENSGR